MDVEVCIAEMNFDISEEIAVMSDIRNKEFIFSQNISLDFERQISESCFTISVTLSINAYSTVLSPTLIVYFNTEFLQMVSLYNFLQF